MIENNQIIVGFLHIGYRSETVVWIEDIYVDIEHRNKGIATNAILIVEEILKSKPNISAICFDVTPRNTAALACYHQLGYNNLSLLTIRKELHENKRDKKENILGLDFKY